MKAQSVNRWDATTIAGPGVTRYDVPPTQTIIGEVVSLAVDTSDAVYFSDSRCYVRKITPTGLVNVAGNGICASSTNDTGAATAISIGDNAQVAIGRTGVIYVGDGNRVRKIMPGGSFSTILMTQSSVAALAVDAQDNLWIVAGYQVTRLTAAGATTALWTLPSGSGIPCSKMAVDNIATAYVTCGPSVYRVSQSEQPTIPNDMPWFLAATFRSDGSAILADPHYLYSRSPQGQVTKLDPDIRWGFGGDGGPFQNAARNTPSALAFDSKGVLYLGDYIRVRAIDANGTIRTVAGGAWTEGGSALAAQMETSPAVARDGLGNIFVLQPYQVRKISPAGIITTAAGNGMEGAFIEGSRATATPLPQINSIAADAAGNLIIASTGILKVGTDGIIHQISTTPASRVAVDGAGNIYAQLSDGSTLRKITPQGVISDSAPGDIQDLVTDAKGNVFVLGADKHVRRISASGEVTPFMPGQVVFDPFTVDGNNRVFWQDVDSGGVYQLVSAGWSGLDDWWKIYDQRKGQPVNGPMSGIARGVIVEPGGSLLTVGPEANSIVRLTEHTCQWSLSTYSIYYNPVSGFQPVTVSTEPGCPCNVVVKTPGILGLSGVTQGIQSGPGTVQLVLDSYYGTPPATSTITIAGRTVTVSVPQQRAVSRTINVSIPASGSSSSLTLTPADAPGNWNTASDRNWIQVFPLSGSGAGTVNYTVYPNFGSAARSGTFMAGGVVVSVNQAASSLTAEERLVQRFYFNFFGRLPSSSELTFQVNSLRTIGRATLFDSFFRSPEFDSGGRFIAGLYVGLLNRDAEYSGWLFQRNALSVAAVNYTSLIANFLSSQEFQGKNGVLADDDFVRLLYRQVLLREPTGSEVTFQATGVKTLGRVQIASNFLLSTEFRIGTGPRLTAFLLYALTLGREASAAEFTSMVARLNDGATVPSLVEGLFTLDEFN